MTRDKAVKLVKKLTDAAFDHRVDGATYLAARDEVIAAITAPAAEPFDEDEATRQYKAMLGAPAAGEDDDVERLRDYIDAYMSDKSDTALQGFRACIDRISARLRAVPQGWKLVPLEATAEMMKAVPDYPMEVNYWDFYRILVAAAPAPEKDQPK
jgi:hypothetical protein